MKEDNSELEVNGKKFVFKKPVLRIAALASRLEFDNLKTFPEKMVREMSAEDEKYKIFVEEMDRFFDLALESKPEGFTFGELQPMEVAALQNFFIARLLHLRLKHNGVSLTLKDLINPRKLKIPQRDGG